MESAEIFVKEIIIQLKNRTLFRNYNTYIESDKEFKNSRRRPSGPRPLRIIQKSSSVTTNSDLVEPVSILSPTPNPKEYQNEQTPISPERRAEFTPLQFISPPQRSQWPQTPTPSNFTLKSILKQSPVGVGLQSQHEIKTSESPTQIAPKIEVNTLQISSKNDQEALLHRNRRRRVRLPGRWVKEQLKLVEYMTPLREKWSSFFKYPELSILLFVVQLLVCIYGIAGIVSGIVTFVDLLTAGAVGSAMGSSIHVDSLQNVLGKSGLKMGHCSFRNSGAATQAQKIVPVKTQDSVIERVNI
ncbi:hypothetical protein HK096_000465, partial [Nowakowskiella sp. JEL0078]